MLSKNLEGRVMVNTSYGEPLRFLQQSILQSTDECILWPYALSNGYPVLRIDGKVVRASQHVLTMGGFLRPSKRHIACHKPIVCHEPLCINVSHLRWGTIAENQYDKFKDNTVVMGEKINTAKLTETDVLEIRHLLTKGIKYKDLSEIYLVSEANISNIKNRKIWKHI